MVGDSLSNYGGKWLLHSQYRRNLFHAGLFYCSSVWYVCHINSWQCPGKGSQLFTDSGTTLVQYALDKEFRALALFISVVFLPFLKSVPVHLDLCNSNFAYVRCWKHHVAKELLSHSGVELLAAWITVDVVYQSHIHPNMVSRARFKFNHGCTYCALRKLHTYLWYCLIPAHPNWTEEPEMRADAIACCTIHVLCTRMYPAHWWWQLELTAGSKHQVKTSDGVSQIHITCIYMHRAL